MPKSSVQVGLLFRVAETVGSLDQELGILTISFPPAGMEFLGVSVKVKGARVLT
jgi:hypothetical protein